ncbi:sulfite exporter TauE/SafE family protein [Thermogladius sp. KZ2Tp1]|uniref:sulfite exporter TauE/SafE family protein n=1 Tax=Thermogladius sp. KZ2Tp1 TaxID=3136289 RepID=UPI003DA87286
MDLYEVLASLVSGLIVGFSLGLVGGGGSILAVPLLLYFVGLENSPDAAHVAIGTTALAVGVNAYVNSYIHLRKRNVSPCIGLVFAGVGLFGSLTGAYLGRITPGRSLLTYFAIAMITLGVYMAARRESPRAGTIHEVDRVVKAFEECRVITKATTIKVGFFGFLVGLLSGYFGIGGGFLIVPSLMFSAGLCITRAIGTSLISVGTFGVASGVEYALTGHVIPSIAFLYVLGGVVGGYLGTNLSVKAPRDKLRVIYGLITVSVGFYMLAKVQGLI